MISTFSIDFREQTELTVVINDSAEVFFFAEKCMVLNSMCDVTRTSALPVYLFTHNKKKLDGYKYFTKLACCETCQKSKENISTSLPSSASSQKSSQIRTSAHEFVMPYLPDLQEGTLLPITPK